MTVERKGSRIYHARFASVSKAIRVVLAKGHGFYRYKNTEKTSDGRQVSTTIVPWVWPLMFSTELLIDIEPGNDNTTVSVQTRSQSAVMADIFGFYSGYILRFLDAVDDSVRREFG